MAEKKIRYTEIDIAKGVGILFVVLGHSFPNSLELSGASALIYNTIYSFHMPMFFPRVSVKEAWARRCLISDRG